MNNDISYQNWLEYDYSPFFLFSNKGEILYLNNSAQFLVDKINLRELYEIALLNASKGFGFKTTLLELRFDVFLFFAITVGYESDKEIGIKLYNSPYLIKNRLLNFKDYELANIYKLIDLCISSAMQKKEISFKKEIDPALPEFKLNQNSFAKILIAIFDSFIDTLEIKIRLKLKIGEFLQLSEKKIQILKLEIIGKQRDVKADESIEELCLDINILSNIASDRVVLNIPFVT